MLNREKHYRRLCWYINLCKKCKSECAEWKYINHSGINIFYKVKQIILYLFIQKLKIDLNGNIDKEEQKVKDFLSRIAKNYGHKLIFYDEPKGDIIGIYDNIPIIRSDNIE